MRKPGLVFTFERTKCQLLPSLCLSLSSVKHLSATFPKLVTVIYLFSSSLWKLLIKSSLRRKLCHYLDSSDFLFFLVSFEGYGCMKEGGERRMKITDFPLVMHRGVVLCDLQQPFVSQPMQTRPAVGVSALGWLEGRDQPLPKTTKVVIPQCLV